MAVRRSVLFVQLAWHRDCLELEALLDRPTPVAHEVWVPLSA